MTDESTLPYEKQSLVFRLRERARIRRQIPTRKSVQDNEPDRLSDLLEEAANEIENLRSTLRMKIDQYLTAMLGKENVTKWWYSPNKAFLGATPNEVYLTNPETVEMYVMACASGSYC